ncbi:MAG: DUF3090 domain-containing protein [Anaerolineae bacterium]|nr:DUF3090 domain-containing protein [Anaerolineae bacterium]
MPNGELELDPVDYITVGTVGPKGKRQFHLQAGKGAQIVSLIMEKEQTRALSEALRDLLDTLLETSTEQIEPEVNLSRWDMSLRDPIEPLFRVAQMGLGYDETRDLVVVVAHELISTDEEQDDNPVEPQVVRFWGTREQMRALSAHARQVVKQGRADPKSNGHLINYWT